MARFPKGAVSWAFYDWANSAFILTVVTVFYGPFFQNYWYNGAPERALFWQSVSVTISSIIVAIAAPLLGALASSGPVKKRYLAIFMAVGAVSTLALAALPAGAWVVAVLIRIVAALGFFGSLVFYDALLVDVSTSRNRHIISGMGFSLGYLGSVILFMVQFLFVSNPQWLGWESTAPAVKLSFVTVALWWFAFTIPLLLNVEEKARRPDARTSFSVALHNCLKNLWKTALEILAHRTILVFLLAYYFYIDGVNTLTQMATGFAANVGIEEADLMGAIILVQVVGVPCAILMGWLGQRFRPMPLIVVSIVVYMGVTAYAWKLSNDPITLFGFEFSEMYVLGFLIGLVQGGMQALSRSYFSSLLPEGNTSGYFGFYNMLGKGGAIVGPLLMGGVGLFTGDPRWGALAVASLFLVGLILLALLPKQQA